MGSARSPRRPTAHGGHGGEGETDAEGAAALAATVERLRQEVDGLHQAMRSRAAIEQAKGMLMERHGIGPDEAFERLARLSQHANVKLVDVASALVEVSLSETMRSPVLSAASVEAAQESEEPRRPQTPGDAAQTARRRLVERWPQQGEQGEFGTRVRAQGRRTRTRTELLAAREPQDMVTTVVRTALGDDPPQYAALAVIGVNGVLSLAGWHGIAGPVAARWRSVPVDLPLPVCAAARTAQPAWLDRDPGPGPDGQAADPSGTPSGPTLGLGIPEDWSTAAVLPLVAGGAPVGVLALVWTHPHPWDATARAGLESIAAGVAVGVRRLPGTGLERRADPHAAEPPDSALGVLDVIFHPVLLCVPVLEPDARISDLRVRHANPAAVEAAATGAETLTGRRFLELWPDAVRRGLFAACLRVLQTGDQEDLPDHPWRLREDGRSRTARADVRLTRYGGGVLITWTNVRAGSEDGSA